jgi:hypothetical protein
MFKNALSLFSVTFLLVHHQPIFGRVISSNGGEDAAASIYNTNPWAQFQQQEQQAAAENEGKNIGE